MEKIVLKRNFNNRRWVWLGFTRWGFDESRLTESGRKTIEDNVKGFGLDMKIGNEYYVGSTDKPFGIEFIAEKPHTIIDRVIDTSAEWEKTTSYANVLFDEEENKYKLWYGMFIDLENFKFTKKDGAEQTEAYVTMYAESDDGINWVKPELDFVFCNGKPTNILPFHINHGGIFIDPNREDKFKFKASVAIVNWVKEIPEEKRFRVEIVGSKDGINWEFIGSDPLYRFFDTQNIVAYDKMLGKYVGYFRHQNVGRSISRSEADDIKKLPMPTCIMSPTVDDPVDTDYYTNGFTVHPYDDEMRILYSAMFHHSSDTTDIRMAVSTDGRFFEWVSREPIIDNYDINGKFFGQVYAFPPLLPLGKNVGLLYNMHEFGHDDWRGEMYGEKPESKYCMALWNADRLAGVKAEGTGEFFTDLKLKNGKLQINYRTLSPKGNVKVEIQDKSIPVENFTINDSSVLSGDGNWVDCSWNGNSDLEKLPSMNCKIRIRIENAIVYGIRVIAEDDTEINTQKTYNAL